MTAACAIIFCSCDVVRIVCSHQLIKVDGVAATCETDGMIEHWHCTVCQKNFTDESGKTELEDVVTPASHRFGAYEYDYTLNTYSRSCPQCGIRETEAAGNSGFPYLVRNETELAQIVTSAGAGSFIKLANDVEITTGAYEVITRIPDGGTLDLGGYTVTVKINGGFTVEGTDVTLQNGSVVTDFANPKAGYALFIGDMGDNNRVTVKNIESRGGFNVYNCVATVYDCNVDSSGYTYYALWADQHATVCVESGVFTGGEIACVHSSSSEADKDGGDDGRGRIIINGGEFHGKIVATDLTVINGGEFDSEISVSPYSYSGKTYQGKLVVSKDYKGILNVVCGSGQHEIVTSVDEEGNTVYQTVEKSQEP